MLSREVKFHFEEIIGLNKILNLKVVKLEKIDLKNYGSRYGAYGEIIYLHYARESSSNLLVINEENTGGFIIGKSEEIDTLRKAVVRMMKQKGYECDFPNSINKKYKGIKGIKLCFKLNGGMKTVLDGLM